MIKSLQFTSTIKGLITGLVMVAVGLVLYFNKVDEASPLQYSAYFIYGLGIVWSVTSYLKQRGGAVKFRGLFSQGFRCFVVVTLLMALYTLIFYKMNTGLIEEKAVITREQLLKTEKSRTPAEIDQMVQNGKKYFAVTAASAAIFQYLFIGVVVTVATAGALSLRNKNE